MADDFEISVVELRTCECLLLLLLEKQAKNIVQKLFAVDRIVSDLWIIFSHVFATKQILIFNDVLFLKNAKSRKYRKTFMIHHVRLTNIIWGSIVLGAESRKEPSVHNLIQTKNSPSVHTELVADVDFSSLRIVNEKKKTLWTHKNVHNVNNSWLLNNKVFHDFRAFHLNSELTSFEVSNIFVSD